MCGVSNRYTYLTRLMACALSLSGRKEEKREQHRVSFFFSANVTSSQSTAGTKLALIYGTFTSSFFFVFSSAYFLERKKKEERIENSFSSRHFRRPRSNETYLNGPDYRDWDRSSPSKENHAKISRKQKTTEGNTHYQLIVLYRNQFNPKL